MVQPRPLDAKALPAPPQVPDVREAWACEVEPTLARY